MPARHVEIQVLCDAHGRRPDARRARVLDPAPPPEADRGVAFARARPGDARGDGGRRRAGLPGDRVRQRRHVRVPARARGRLLLHRAERAAAGRAPGLRARDRDRRRARAAPRGRRRAARARGPRAAARARDRVPDQRRGSLAGLRAGAGADRAPEAAGGAGRPGRHSRRGRAATCRRTTTRCSRRSSCGTSTGRAAIERAIRALRELEVVGMPTTREVAIEILDSPSFRSGEYHTGYLAETELAAVSG